MDRAITEGNRVVNWRQLMINKALHKQKLQDMTKAVDNNPPYSYKNPLNKKSKEFKLEGKLQKILTFPNRKMRRN